jgi:hypothetical protein
MYQSVSVDIEQMRLQLCSSHLAIDYQPPFKATALTVLFITTVIAEMITVTP